jgi:predicted nucleic acid-binding protein
MKLLLDTSVLIDVLRKRKGRAKELTELAQAGYMLATTVLNIAELYSGMRPGEEVRTEALLSGLQWLDLTATAARLAGKLKWDWSQKGRTLALTDTIVAAIAIENQFQLFTDNRRDFPMTELSLYTPRV